MGGFIHIIHFFTKLIICFSLLLFHLYKWYTYQKRKEKRINMNKKHLFLIVVVFGLASCSTAPEKIMGSKEANSSSYSEERDSSDLSESLDSISSTTSSYETEESSVNQFSQGEKDFSDLKWESVEEAIAFFEQTYESPQNNIQEEVPLQNYDRSDWIVEEMGNNQVLLRWLNPDNSDDRYYMEMFKVDGFTKLDIYQGELNIYEGDTMYRAIPFKEYMVRDSDLKVFDSIE